MLWYNIGMIIMILHIEIEIDIFIKIKCLLIKYAILIKKIKILKY